MTPNPPSTSEIISMAESYAGIQAGIVLLRDVLEGPSHQDATSENKTVRNGLPPGTHTKWPAGAQTVLVLGLHHPAEAPRLDYWERGDTWGNRRLREISAELQYAMRWAYHLSAYPLPYHVEKGGLFLKDAAALSGIGIIGRNNLLIHPQWGPRIRLRAILLEGRLEPTPAHTNFGLCESCEGFCRKACPRKAFAPKRYSRIACNEQMNADLANILPLGEIKRDGHRDGVVSYCRACEMACPVGA